MKERGITLIELIVVISIIGILIVAFGFSFKKWMEKYRIEKQMREMYSDLLNFKTKAMQRNRVHFIVLNNNSYTIYEDTNPVPDGNDTLETGADTKMLSKNLLYPIVATFELPATLRIDQRGLLGKNGIGVLRIDFGWFSKEFRDKEPPDSDYDCLNLKETRINMGKWNDNDKVCEEK